MHICQSMTYGQISEQLGITRADVERELLRALEICSRVPPPRFSFRIFAVDLCAAAFGAAMALIVVYGVGAWPPAWGG